MLSWFIYNCRYLEVLWSAHCRGSWYIRCSSCY